MEEDESMMYRGVQHLLDRVQDIQRHLRSAILAETTSEMTTHSGAAQTLADTLLQEVDNLLAAAESSADAVTSVGTVELTMTRAARPALVDAINEAEKIALASNVHDMRERLLDFKTHVDYADAYLRDAEGLGTE